MVGRAISCPPIRSVLAMLALASGSAGCQFSPSGQGVADGAVPDVDARMIDAAIVDARESDGREPDARDPDARESDAGEPDAAVLPPAGELVERDLLTRYFIDESNSGATVPALLDSAPDPLDLPIIYDALGVFVEESGNRGLRWNGLTENGRAAAPLDASGKIKQNLGGSTEGTIEVVIDIDQFVAGSRISHIGEPGDRGAFTLRLEENPARVRFVLNQEDDDVQQNYWDVDVVGKGRTVLHLVLDTTRATASERVRLYVDGREEPPSAGNVPPARNTAIELRGAQDYYVLGNSAAGSDDGGRGFLGTLFYAAMYSAALEPAEVDHNFDILRQDDDTP